MTVTDAPTAESTGDRLRVVVDGVAYSAESVARGAAFEIFTATPTPGFLDNPRPGARLRYRRFVVWNVTGALLWVVGLTVVALALGRVPFVAHNIDLLAVVVVVVSVIPIVVTALRRRAATGTPEGDRATVHG